MISLQADDQRLLKELSAFMEPVQIVDPNGRPLGLFVPAADNLAEAGASPALQQGLAWLGLLDQEWKRRAAAGERQFTKEEAVAYYRALRHSLNGSGGTGAQDKETK